FKYRDPFTKKSELFFADYFGADTTKHKRARVRISSSLFDSSDLPNIKKAIGQLNWGSKKYLETKKKWIDVLGSFSDSATTGYLSQLYVQVKDTSDLQNVILDALLDNRTKYSFETFKNLILKEPPALLGTSYGYSYDHDDYDMVTTAPSYSTYSNYGERGYGGYSGRWFQLYDTLQLTSAILPELVDLMALEDYESTVMNLLITAVDSGYLKKEQYKQFYNRFLLEAKQLAKKQIAMEEKRAIDKASSEDEDEDNYNYYGSNEDNGNQKLVDYAVLLMPFWDHEEVRAFFDKLHLSKDKRLKFDMALLMLRNRKPVADSSIQQIAAQDNYRISLYRELEDQKLLDKFPANYKKQEDFARGMLQTFSYRKPDSLIFLEKHLVTLQEGKKGWAYFYKYKQMKDDPKWKIAVSGLQPFDESKVVATFKDNYDMSFIEFTDENFEEKGGNLATTLQKLVKEKIYEKRASASRFYAGKDSDMYESFLPDRVKATRYD
ncbi:MAG: TraB/GumN family protein, partial [Chitinophagaceae bacterium]|nr:TraB/GumN family protein [Chitinophagaceae bacterium]